MNASSASTPSAPSAVPSKAASVAGLVLQVILVLFLLMDGVMKLVQPAPVKLASTQFKFSSGFTAALGIIVLAGTVALLLPRIRAIGAVLLTGYLGGAVGCQIEIQAPTVSTLFPLVFCGLLWVSLVLRDPRFRALLR